MALLVRLQELLDRSGVAYTHIVHPLAYLPRPNTCHCDLGAMPPFGNLYGVPVYLDSGLLSDEQIAFNACTHRDVVHVRLNDFRQMVNPEVVSLAREAPHRNAAGWRPRTRQTRPETRAF